MNRSEANEIRSSQWRYRIMLILLSTAALLGLNPYTYGVFNHYVTIPFYLDRLSPELFPGDELIGEQAYFYTWFIKGLAGIGRVTGAGPELLFFIVHVLAVYAAVFAFWRLGKTLFGRPEPALYSTVLFLFGVKVLGGISTFESLLMERTLVLPLELWAFYFCVRGRWVASFALVGLAFLFHPLSAVYTGVMIGAAGLYGLLRGDRSLNAGTFLLALLAGALISSPSVYLKLVSEAPSMPAFGVTETWLEILSIRSSHHVFPSTWGVSAFILSGLFVFGFYRNAAGFAPEEKHRRILAASLSVLIMALLGSLFSEVYPASLPIQFQFWRSFRFLSYFGMLYAGWRLWRTVEGEYGWGDGLITIVLVMALWGEAEPVKLAGVAAVLLLIHPGLSYATVKLGWGLQQRTNVLVAIVMGLAAAGLSQRGFSTASAQDPEWRQVQQWAQDATPREAAFIVPPNRPGFRVESQRRIYGDWNDGTQNFFNHEFGESWLARMQKLGYQGDPDVLGRNYRNLMPSVFEEIADEMAAGEVYAVLFADQTGLGETLFENGSFKIVQIR